MDRRSKMIVLLCALICVWCGVTAAQGSLCLTGSITDVQTWVHRNGSLTLNAESLAMDMSSTENPGKLLDMQLKAMPSSSMEVRAISMARCNLAGVPEILTSIQNPNGVPLVKSLEYLSFYDNNFASSDNTTSWSTAFNGVEFEMLKELDLRACRIEILTTNQFSQMPNLEALYLGENQIRYIEHSTFFGLANLLHLDLSRNTENEGVMIFESPDIFEDLPNIESMDFSFTKIEQSNASAFWGFGSKLERLSICNIGISNIDPSFLNSTSMKILDISGNHGILSTPQPLNGLESSLHVLYANNVSLINFDIFENFSELQILRLAHNELVSINPIVAVSMTNLQTLDLANNRIISWFMEKFLMPKLQSLDLINNKLNTISHAMYVDLANISYVGLSGNKIICSCMFRDIVELASNNERRVTAKPIQPAHQPFTSRFRYHSGFEDINVYLNYRQNISYICEHSVCTQGSVDGRMLLLDYTAESYSCFMTSLGKSVSVNEVLGCSHYKHYVKEVTNQWTTLLFLLFIPGLLLPMLFMTFKFRRNLRYFFVTMRNSAMLSMVSKRDIDENTVFNYDVFVSYCNEDRAWVLNGLLGNLEKDCNVSLCLHERDFQVGLSILENIVSCMDRSKTIVLVISQRFLLSQWCQFEMHLAQHRLIETRREDLILILLEDIPRWLRPNTLHYLMLTKTYIIWPKNKSEEPQFWKRLKKSIITQNEKHKENVSLA